MKASRAGEGLPLAWTLAACLAVAWPPLIAYNVPPSATFFNQAAAFAGWGAFLLCLASRLSPRTWPRSAGLRSLLASLAVLMGAAAAAPWWTGLPPSLALSSVGVIAAAAFVSIIAAGVCEAGLSRPAFDAFCIGLVVAGLASAAVGLLQVYAPRFPDGDWIARTPVVGRAVGNMRQPNHLSSLLLWSIVAVVWLRERGRVPDRLAWIAAAVLMDVIVLSGSRTGAVGCFVLASWGALDRRLSRPARIALIVAPVAYAVLWVAALEISHVTHVVFGGETRFSTHGDVSSSRFAIWSNTLQLIAMHPLAGVGFGEFNFAWTLTPFPDRPVQFFDHTHDIVLQFIVELGIPLGLLTLALLLFALRVAVRRAVADRGDGAPVTRAALVMVLMVLVHSLLEYPLWYSYFLFPAAFAFGLCLAGPPRDAAASQANQGLDGKTTTTRPWVLAAMVMPLIAAVSLWDYSRVVVIFAPPADAGPLEDRIEAGRHSWFFAPHADYAAATTAAHPATTMNSFKVATHYLLDTRLMMAWARALEEAGDDERARYVAQRLREFRNEGSDSFFAPCVDANAPAAERPFQCKAPTRTFTYEDFR